MSTNTVELQRPKRRNGWQNPAMHVMAITRALPFFRQGQGTYIHRVRSGCVYFWNNQPSHTVFELWCGSSGYAHGRRRGMNVKGEMLADPPMGYPVCATCEGRAIGAGQVGSRMICGRVVKFSPQHTHPSQLAAALDHYQRNFKGHHDCPPRVEKIIMTLRATVHAEHPEYYENFFCGPYEPKPAICVPLPLVPFDSKPSDTRTIP